MSGQLTVDKAARVRGATGDPKDVVFPGKVLGTCSADMRDLVPAPSRCRRTWHGRALGVRLSDAVEEARIRR